MSEQRAKILILVEGAKTDVKLMNHLLEIYGISEKYEIVSYNTNIYVLYKDIFENDDPGALDLLYVLREREKDEEKKKVFDERYTDILLIFDLDPHDGNYSDDKIQKMLRYFNESSENGKLYINYPMVESFYHMRSIPDPEYNNYTVSLLELKNKEYKMRVQKENRNHDYQKFAKSREECSIVIRQNIEKSHLITENNMMGVLDLVEDMDIFNVQAKKISNEDCLYVLCTCAFYIVCYNPELIK